VHARQIEDEEIRVEALPAAQGQGRSALIDFHGVLGQDGLQLPGPVGTGLEASTKLVGSAEAKAEELTGSAKEKQSPTTAGRPAKANAWEAFEVNQFKVRNQEPSQIIDKLRVLTASPIPFMAELPPSEELDSTEALDSFMEAFNKIVSERAVNFTADVKKSLHLATGTRTEFCEAVLAFICHHQKLETAFSDSVEFFMESLTNGVRLEEDNRAMKQTISHLLELKEGGVLQKFNLEKRLKEQVHNVDKITEKEKLSQNKIKQLQK
jgi:hypothetical protein